MLTKTRLMEIIRDLVALVDGSLSGKSQRDGILREAHEAIEAWEKESPADERDRCGSDAPAERVASPESPSPEGLGRSGVEAESIRRMAEYISDHSVFATTEAQAVARAYLALLALSPRAE